MAVGVRATLLTIDIPQGVEPRLARVERRNGGISGPFDGRGIKCYRRAFIGVGKDAVIPVEVVKA